MEALKISKIVEVVQGTLVYGDGEVIVTNVSISSNEISENTLFVPIIGERVDAHRFMEGALRDGAVATFTSKTISEEEYVGGKAYIQVEDTVKALQDLASYYRGLFDIPVIGVTGSVGKTTTKEMIAAALETKYDVLKTAGNMNSQVGLPLTMFRIEKSHQVAVIEMGMSEEGELAVLATIARPTIAVVTNVGVSHIAQLGSKENIRKEKLNIINEMQDGMLYFNGNDGLLRELVMAKEALEMKREEGQIDLVEKTKQALAKVLLNSYGTANDATCMAKEIRVQGGNTTFAFEMESEQEEIALQVLGEHNVMNACVALGIAKQLGIDVEVAKQGLYNYQPIAMRGQIEQVKGVKIIDDSYNASPDSMKSGINVLLAMSDVTRRIAVLADVLELGDKAKECHYEVGTYLVDLYKQGQKIDELIVVGKEAKAIAQGVEDGKVDIITNRFENNEQVVSYLLSRCKQGDAILVKGSRGMKTDQVVSGLKEKL